MAWSDGGVRFLSFIVVTLIPAVVRADINPIDSIQDSARWVASEFSQCSVVCGGGIQVRTLTCVRNSLKHGRSHEKKVGKSLCTYPTPPMTKHCNKHECTGSWKTGKWSECSASCGTGTQEREVLCQVIHRQGQGNQAAQVECSGSVPAASRRCHIADCPFSTTIDPSSILAENYTLLQLYKTRKIKVNVGGQVNLLPGQTVVVKCPVKHLSKHLIYWSKGYRLVKVTGRVRTTKSGGLYIGKSEPKTDSGVYTCTAEKQTATVNVSFIEKNDPSAKMYKEIVQKSNRKHAKYPGKYKNSVRKNSAIAATDIASDELNQQRDQSQSHNFSESLSFVTSDWSKCSACCGARGHRKRKVTCSHLTPIYVKIVSDDECYRAGLNKPETTEECSEYPNIAVWKTGPWSECLPLCGRSIHASRTLTCVWELTGEPAGRACDPNNKPSVLKPCKSKTCPLECSDNSSYCSLARLLKLCRFFYFQQKCCLTCQLLSYSRRL